VREGLKVVALAHSSSPSMADFRAAVRCDSTEKAYASFARTGYTTLTASVLPPMPSLGSFRLETLTSFPPTMFIAWVDSHVCTARLTQLVSIAHCSSCGETTTWGGRECSKA